MKTSSVKKTLTIPEWLNELALEEHLQFSKILQDGLMDAVGVYSYKEYCQRKALDARPIKCSQCKHKEMCMITEHLGEEGYCSKGEPKGGKSNEND